jgi:hypothetical protein
MKKKPVRKSKTTASRKPAAKKAGVRSQKNPRKSTRVAGKPSRLAAAPRAGSVVAKPSVKPAPVPSLGRPKITGEEDLDLFFKEDFHARQVFKFLNVRTLKELERYSAGEILRRLSNPIKETVERIRRSLAVQNRCLAGDENFALQKKEEAATALRGN